MRLPILPPFSWALSCPPFLSSRSTILPVLLYLLDATAHSNQSKPGCYYAFEMFGWVATSRPEETSKYVHIQMLFSTFSLVHVVAVFFFMMSYLPIECRRKLITKTRNTKKASTYWRRAWWSKNDGSWRNQSTTVPAKADISNCVNYSWRFVVSGFRNIIVPEKTKCDENKFMKYFGVTLFSPFYYP